MNKIIKLLLILILSIIVVVLSLFLCKYVNSDYDFKFSSVFSNTSTNLIESKEFYSINDIIINSNIADVEIKNNSQNNFKVDVYSEKKENYSIDVNNNNLYINIEDDNNIIFNKHSKLVLYVPSDYNKLVKIVNKTGDVEVESLMYLNLDIESNTGDVEIDSVDSLNYRNSVGDLEINNINTLNVDCKTGDVEVNNINKVFNIKSNTGDVDINTINISENSYIESNIGDIDIKTINNIYVETESGIGDVDVNNGDRFSPITLRIKSSVGDIKVNK